MASKTSPSPVASQSVSPPPPPTDLRHMTSNPTLASPSRDHRRTSQHLRTGDPRVGSKSPNSIPSSPTSIHSSSSAIFERDIEPIIPPSPPALLSQHAHHHHPPNPHRIPRAKGTEALEHSVPSVLDSAAAILSTLETDADVAEQVAVVAPVASPLENLSLGGRSSGFASPIGSFRSRSPSPLGSRTGGGRGAEQLLLNIPASGSQPQPLSSAISSPPTSALGLQGMTSGVASSTSASGPSSTSASSPSTKPLVISTADAAPQPVAITQATTTTLVAADAPSVTSATTPSIVRSATDENGDVTVTASSEEDSEPLTTTQEHPPALPSPQRSPRRSPAAMPPPSLPLSPSTLVSPPSLSSTTSPVSSPSSAHVTLSSHPPSPVHVAKKRLSFMSYSDLLSSTPASLQPLSSLTTGASSEPPPHIPSVSGLNLVNAIHAQQSSQAQSPQSGPGSATPSLRGFPLFGPAGGVTHAGKRDSIAMLDNVGGEWEKQGLGKGLEERLEALVIPPPGGVAMSPVVGGKA